MFHLCKNVTFCCQKLQNDAYDAFSNAQCKLHLMNYDDVIKVITFIEMIELTFIFTNI